MAGVIISYFRTTRIQIAALIYFLLAGILTQIPLFNYLGFEFSALMTIPTAFISGILTILFMREHRAKPLTRRTWLYVILDYLVINLLLLIIPLLVISFNALVVKNCAYGKGLIYYFLLPMVTMIFSVSFALCVGVLFRKAIVVYCVFIVLILSQIAFVTYTQPQLFAYNFILGFFPGITYDETLTDNSLLFLYREFTIIASLMFISLFFIFTRTIDQHDTLINNFVQLRNGWEHDRMLWGVTLLCFILLLCGHIFRAELGFEYSAEDIQQALGRRTESNHFIMYYHDEDYTQNDIRRMKAEIEFQYRKVSDGLMNTENNSGKISVYLYPNEDWKQRFIGTANTNIAKPWKREIHLTVSTYESTFRHELVHALAAEFGLPVIGASSHMGLNEGLAVAIDWDAGLFTPHQYAAALLREHGLEAPENLFTYSGFAVQSSSYAYLVSGSFVRYLIDRFGVERFRRTFPNGNFVAPFGESLESLLRDWKAFLTTVDDSAISRETVHALFFQQSIFFKTCAREVAGQNQRAIDALRSKNYSLAEAEFTDSYANAPTAYALRGLFQTLNLLHKPKEVINRFRLLQASSSLTMNPSILLAVADAYYMDKEPRAAQTMYTTIRSMNYSESFTEAIALRMQFLDDAISPTVFQSMFYGGLNDSAKISVIENTSNVKKIIPALVYLRGTLSSDSLSQRIVLFMSISKETISPDLRYFASLRSAILSFKQYQYEDAKVFYWQAKNNAPTEALSSRIDEKIELCDYITMEL